MPDEPSDPLEPFLTELQQYRIRTPFFRAFVLFGKILTNAEGKERESLLELVNQVRHFLETRGNSKSWRRHTSAPTDLARLFVPMFQQGFHSRSPNDRQDAVRAASEVSDKATTIPELTEGIAGRLADSASWVAVSAAAALEHIALNGWDLEPILGTLEETLEHLPPESESIRRYLAPAISRYFQTAGVEEPLVIHPDVKSDSYWTVSVSHRRVWAASDEPLKKDSQREWDHPSWHICGVCGHPDITLIGYHWDCGNAWKFLKYEYKCPACGKYTLYEYDD